jgi:hypothetical protein
MRIGNGVFARRGECQCEPTIRHVDIVLESLTKAGFTINANKCTFCQAEIAFLGYTISPQGVHSDPRRVSAILNYPAPRNPKLRQFLGTRNYYHRFIINYAMYVHVCSALITFNEKRKQVRVDRTNAERFRVITPAIRGGHTSHSSRRRTICYIHGRLQIRNKQYSYPVRRRWITRDHIHRFASSELRRAKV